MTKDGDLATLLHQHPSADCLSDREIKHAALKIKASNVNDRNFD